MDHPLGNSSSPFGLRLRLILRKHLIYCVFFLAAGDAAQVRALPVRGQPQGQPEEALADPQGPQRGEDAQVRAVRLPEQAQGQDQAAHVQHAQVFSVRFPDQGQGGARRPPEVARAARAELQVSFLSFFVLIGETVELCLYSGGTFNKKLKMWG